MLGASAVWCCRFWRQVPGHLRCVESNCLGLVWGIGWDGTAWVYSRRYGQQPTPGKHAPVDPFVSHVIFLDVDTYKSVLFTSYLKFMSISVNNLQTHKRESEHLMHIFLLTACSLVFCVQLFGMVQVSAICCSCRDTYTHKCVTIYLLVLHLCPCLRALQGKRFRCTSRLMSGVFMCMRIKDGTL